VFSLDKTPRWRGQELPALQAGWPGGRGRTSPER